MSRHITTFQSLISENIKEIMSDPEELARIEKKLEERAMQKNNIDQK